MKITGTAEIQVGTDWPCQINIEEIGEDLLASVFMVSALPLRCWEGQQVRVLLKENLLTFFISPYPDAVLPEYWQDAKVIFEHRQPPFEERRQGLHDGMK